MRLDGFTDNAKREADKAVLSIWKVNPWGAKLNNLIFHPLEIVSRYRDPQLQLSENCTY